MAPLGTKAAPAPTAPPRPAHVEFLGLPFSLLSQADVIRHTVESLGARYRYVVTPNAYHVVAAHDDPARLLPIYRNAWLSLCDSRIVRGLARLERHKLPLVTGSDLVPALLAALSGGDRPDRPTRILVVGPSRDAMTALCAAYPALTFEVLPAPSGLAQRADLRLAIARACLQRDWDVALLCVGAPAQELIAHELGELGRKTGVALCVGASIDFLTGVRSRAPRWLQNLSLEWAYRLAQEPGRLWRRYLVQSPKILRIFMTARLSRGD